VFVGIAGVDGHDRNVRIVAHCRLKAGRTQLLHMLENSIHRAPV